MLQSIPLLLALIPLALSSPTPAGKPDQPSKFKPFSLPELYTFSPSGRPGNSPYSTLNVTVTDPNAKGKPTTKCTLQYTNIAEVPTGEIPCEDPTFTFRYIPVQGSREFTLVITHTYPYKSGTEISTTGSVTVESQVVGTPGNGFRIQCGGSGVCSGQLEGPPLEVPITSATGL
ncbi:MAG: hypothetical protein Q9221_000707 [Calogaya cf. arnoldii]